MDNSVLQTIENRVSLRVYDDREISREILDKILHAAMRAPTAGNQMLYSTLLLRTQKRKSCSHRAAIIRHLLKRLRFCCCLWQIIKNGLIITG